MAKQTTQKNSRKKTVNKKSVEAITHSEASRKNLPTAEMQSVVPTDMAEPIATAFSRRNPDLDPQLVWRGKDILDWSDLVAMAPPLYIQEKVHPQVLIDDLRKLSEADEPPEVQLNLFDDFNGLPDADAKTEFYQHEANWQNRMILGDSLQVMASLAEREELRGKVQCIYIDPPYGIKFNSNFQWSTKSRDVKDGKREHITREPEQVKAFRDTWQDGIHSYLTYLRDRLTVARDLLTESGSIFVQIGDENVHRIRALMDEVFGASNFVSQIAVKKTAVQTDIAIPGVHDSILWFARSSSSLKYRAIHLDKGVGEPGAEQYRWVKKAGGRFERIKDQNDYDFNLLCRPDNLTSSHEYSRGRELIDFEGKTYGPGSRYWSTSPENIARLAKAERLHAGGKTLSYVRYLSDYAAVPLLNMWTDTGTGGYGDERYYVVQTTAKIIQRCVLMTTDPGDLVLDPTCGSGTTAYVAEQWGRRWITIDTSRVALALARVRIMGARYPFYILADSLEGQQKEAELSMTAASTQPTYGGIRQGFVYERIPHITLKSIANNTEIDVIWEKFQEVLEPLRTQLNEQLGKNWEEWEIPREARDSWDAAAIENHKKWWATRIDRQREIDASIAAKADFEYLYDKPYEDKKKVRVAGPFTVESVSPFRNLAVGVNGEILDPQKSESMETDGSRQFTEIILENLKKAGVQQAQKSDKIDFISLTPWPGEYICAEGKFLEGGKDTGIQKRAGIFIGPEFGTVSRQALVRAVQEAGEAGFDVVIACAFNFDAPSTEFKKIGSLPILKARMNADLHMAEDLKNTGKGNLFVIFGEPDIEILDSEGGQIQVKIKGIDVFKPQTGEIISNDPEEIACWFVDSNYDDESFFVRQAYFLGANDPYKMLRTTLKAEINEEAWETLHSDLSRPFEKPESGRIAVKVINHLGDEAMRVFNV